VKFPRAAGILLHPTSLPGRFGIGDLGNEARRFADFLAEAGLRIWQVLPLGPTGYGDSPYQSLSAFAGNPLLISPELLARDGLLSPGEVETVPAFPDEAVAFERVIPYKLALLRTAFERFRGGAEYDRFCDANAAWLEPWARFNALKTANRNVAWGEWDPSVTAASRDIEYQRFLQFEFARQWQELKGYCAERGIRVMGDMPIYVAHDSADVWSHPELFEIDEQGRPTVVSGVPPDYFSADGQLWGNPIYHWDRLARAGFAWWIERFRHALSVLDMIRLDHFRGFEAYWEIPGGEPTARNGRWVKGPGAALFEAVEKALGPLPIVAENLGVITPEVEAIRHRFHYPGMSILQFAFGSDPQAPTFRPHNYPRELVAYTGTHDNDTTLGWWNSSPARDSTRTQADIDREHAAACAYLNTDGREIHWTFIRTVFASVADTALAPMQDVLGLGTEARMNLPGSTRNHWRWRMRPGAATPQLAARLRKLAELYDR
jgi:4-alpha-glucanotransferase